MTLKDYLQNPCRMSSLPFWKAKKQGISKEVLVFHKNDYKGIYDEKIIEKYFRLFHNLENITKPILKDGFSVHYIDEKDLEFYKIITKEIIDKSYDMDIEIKEIASWIGSKRFMPSLYVYIKDEKKNKFIGCGIAEVDKNVNEGMLEWIQVIPEYRWQGFDSLLVNTLLHNMKDEADFATVSGKIDSNSNIEALYRKCGFIGEDIWYIIKMKA